MKKLYSFALALGAFVCAEAQVLNQPAGWPNAAWTITGTYNPDPVAFESNPLTTANFAYDDDDAGNTSHEDNIAAESPVIDLTAAFNANERKVQVTVDYGYHYLANDALLLQYWDADMQMWMNWGASIPGNDLNVTNNFCTITKTTYISPVLDLANFTPAKLAGFKYRISYDDNPNGTDWNYGFCFNSPTIKSVGCEAPSNLAAVNITPSSAEIHWTELGGIEGFEYVLDNSAANPASGMPTTANGFNPTDLAPGTLYYVHVRTNCGGSYSEWRTIEFMTQALPPANDSCATATSIASLPYTNTQDATAATNNSGFITVCSGMNDGVWYTFTGDGGDITVTIDNVTGWDPEMGIFRGVCGQFVCVGQKDNGGTGGSETYTIAGSVAGATYYVNIGHYSSAANNAEGPFTLTVSSTVMGAPSFDNSNFSIYPNPVKDTLNLSYNAEISEVIVYNLLGQQILSTSVNANQASVDFSALTQGAYLVKVLSGSVSKTIKVVKQ